MFLKAKVISDDAVLNKTSITTSTYNQRIARVQELASQIRTISNDYRNPNDTIRRHVLRLRQEIADGNWVYKTPI